MRRGLALPVVSDGESLHAFICARLDAHGVLPDSVMSLPDEPTVEPGSPRFVAGALDSIVGGGQDKSRAYAIAKRIVQTAQRPTDRGVRRLYDELLNDTTIEFIDPMLERVVELRPAAEPVTRLGHWLASRSADRGPVKVGLALLGVAGTTDRRLLQELGAHEEFTLFAAVAIRNSSNDPEPELFALAKKVTGWGRIRCVAYLANTDNPEIQRWILREGYRNSIMIEYLALIAATTGRLAEALAVASPDRDLLSAAGEIISALLDSGGPAETIDEYEDAPTTLDQYLRHMTSRAETMTDLLTIADIAGVLEPDNDWGRRVTQGWPDDERLRLRRVATEIIARPVWREIIARDLASDDALAFGAAAQAAQRLGMDTFDALVERIRARPLGNDWYPAWEQADADRARLLTDLATSVIDLDSIATGPSMSTGVGPGFEAHSALLWTLQRLPDYVGLGPELVSAGLQSPSIQNRNSALNVLQAWGPEHCGPDHVRLARALAESDPNPRTREFAQNIVAASDPSGV